MPTVPFVRPPPGELLHSIQTREFMALPPEIRNAHLIPAEEFGVMQAAWTWGEYPAVQIQLHLLRDVTLAEEGLVFLPDLEIVPASITQHGAEEIDDARVAIVAMEPATPLDGPHVLCVKRGASNYGHWLAEMLPMALLANRVLGREVRFLVPPHDGALGRAIRDSLLLAGIEAERIVPWGYEPCHVRELIMVHGLSLHGVYLAPLVAELLSELADRVAPSHPGRDLFVSRAGHPRSLWQEREFGTILSTLGWQVANPGSLSFVDQVALFKGAGRVAGVMGAGLANLLFARPHTRVELFAPANMPDTFYYLISRLRGLRYRETRCWQTRHAFGTAPWDTGLIHTLPELLAALG
jgi:capsular polysaccharide biosynthesis protein